MGVANWFESGPGMRRCRATRLNWVEEASLTGADTLAPPYWRGMPGRNAGSRFFQMHIARPGAIR